jgi:hypothetical protein
MAELQLGFSGDHGDAGNLAPAMTTLATSRIRIMHMPKTGGTWVTLALLGAGVRFEEIEHPDGHAHADLTSTAQYGDRFTAAFVRHPLDWWRSYWRYQMRIGWLGFAEDQIGSDDFNRYIAHVVEHAPGHMSRLLEQYAGPPEAPVDFIGYQERLADGLCFALNLAEEPFDETALRKQPVANASDYEQLPALYELRVAQELAEAERAAIERFYPGEPIPERLLASARRRGRPTCACASATIEARDAAARLSAARWAVARYRVERDRAVTDLEAERARHEQTIVALEAIRNSHLVRLTRPLRVRYYALRDFVRGRRA